MLRLHDGDRWHATVVLLIRLAKLRVEVKLILLRRQRDAWVTGRGHYFRLHVQKDAHSIEVKILRLRVLHLLATAVKEALECKHLRAVHIERFADFYEAFLRDRQGYLLLFDDFIDLIEHEFDLALVAL